MRPFAFALLTLAAQAVPQPARPVIRSGVTYVSTDVAVRDGNGQFVADLRQADFEVFEDGVKQDIAGFTLTHGGRVIADILPPADTVGQGLLLPPPRPPNDASGRVFLIFVDDLHFDAPETIRVRALLKKIRRELVHPGDLIGIVSTGYSSVAVDLTYDHTRLDEAISKVSGSGLQPSEIIGVPEGAQGPVEVRHRAHTAFSTAYDILRRLEAVHNRRKAFIYISDGYDFDPYPQSRAKAAGDRFPTSPDSGQVPDANPFTKGGNEFAAADLAAELAELTRAANRTNTTIYTIDPRGLVAGPGIDQTTLDTRDWQDHVRETQSSLRVIAELTGGFAAINSNDVTKALTRIDGETSDYYVIGYYSSNPDPLKRRRTIEIRVKPTPKRKTDRYQLSYRTSYTLQPR
jgi:VWFA-related protein